MPDPKPVTFKPRWKTTLTPEAEEILSQTPMTGSLPTEPPRIDTRILPRESGYKLSLRSVAEVAELTQKLADYAGYDVAHGLNPDFADLRSLSSDLTKLTRLTSEPFEHGSFIIPACLESDPVNVIEGTSERRIDTDAIAVRFGEMLAALHSSNAPTTVSIGALQTLDALKGVLKREATGIEFSTANSLRQPIAKFQVNDAFLENVRNVIRSRRPSEDKLETLEGRVTSLDILEGKLLLSMIGVSKRVKGNFSHMFTPSLLKSLNQRVRLQGIVEWKGTGRTKQPVIIHIHAIETPELE